MTTYHRAFEAGRRVGFYVHQKSLEVLIKDYIAGMSELIRKSPESINMIRSHRHTYRSLRITRMVNATDKLLAEAKQYWNAPISRKEYHQHTELFNERISGLKENQQNMQSRLVFANF